MTRPPVDIIIPYHGKYELVTRAIAGIVNCTPNQDYRIILADDGSPNADYLATMTAANKRVVGVRLPEQRGFGAALYEGYKAATSEHLLFLHSDAFPDNIYWLANLQRALVRLRPHGVKLVTARTNDAGTATSYDPALVGSPEDVLEDVISPLPVPLFAAYCHRELFARIGGFVRPYEFGWYEDEELFYRMRHYRYHQAIAHNSDVRHDGGATIRDVWTAVPRARKQMEANRGLCLDHIRPFLSRDAGMTAAR